MFFGSAALWTLVIADRRLWLSGMVQGLEKAWQSHHSYSSHTSAGASPVLQKTLDTWDELVMSPRVGDVA